MAKPLRCPVCNAKLKLSTAEPDAKPECPNGCDADLPVGD